MKYRLLIALGFLLAATSFYQVGETGRAAILCVVSLAFVMLHFIQNNKESK